MVTAQPRPHVVWVGEDPATQERVRSWPVGPALLQMLGELNGDVRDALVLERARLDYLGYDDDLRLPGLWWPSRASSELVDDA